MAYNLIITNNADSEPEEIVRYIAEHLDNTKAAASFLDSVESAYDRLTDIRICISFAIIPHLREGITEKWLSETMS